VVEEMRNKEIIMIYNFFAKTKLDSGNGPYLVGVDENRLIFGKLPKLKSGINIKYSGYFLQFRRFKTFLGYFFVLATLLNINGMPFYSTF
jgi:hypothetical protein